MEDKTLLDFLSYDTARYGEKNPWFNTKYSIEIVEVENNQFCLETEYNLIDTTDFKHWQARITVERMELDIPENEREWLIDECYLPFHITAKEKPTIADFEEEFDREVNAILNTLDFEPNRDIYIWTVVNKLLLDWKEITPTHVLRYVTELGYDYEEKPAKDFVYHYDFWSTRLRESCKYFHILICGDGSFGGFNYPIGEMLLHYCGWGKTVDYDMVIDE